MSWPLQGQLSDGCPTKEFQKIVGLFALIRGWFYETLTHCLIDSRLLMITGYGSLRELNIFCNGKGVAGVRI